MRLSLVVLSVLAVMFLSFFGCDSGKPKENVLKEAINTPKEKASSARRAVENAQDAALDQADELDDEAGADEDESEE